MGSLLVTGGCGFIGANLIRQLPPSRPVRVLDNLSRGRVELLPEGDDVEVLIGDIRDPDAVRAALRGVEVVIHLAAFGSVAESVAEPTENFEVNVRGTFDLLRHAAAAGASKFIFASTGGAIMGDAPPPVDEDSLPWPVSPYGASKLCGEAYCHAFAGSFGLQTVALRFANVYGPFSAHKRGVVTRFIVNALRSERLEIYGDGKATRDFLHVDDLCRGIVAAVDASLSDDVLHLASETETSINELAEIVLDLVAKPDLPIVHHHRRPGEIERNFARSDRAAQALGFSPSLSLREGLQDTIDWFSSLDRVSAR
jgi:UDP-glucose 4-epimerase